MKKLSLAQVVILYPLAFRALPRVYQVEEPSVVFFLDIVTDRLMMRNHEEETYTYDDAMGLWVRWAVRVEPKEEAPDSTPIARIRLRQIPAKLGPEERTEAPRKGAELGCATLRPAKDEDK